MNKRHALLSCGSVNFSGIQREFSLLLFVLFFLCNCQSYERGLLRKHAPSLVSYAYYEKDNIQADNFDFFLTVGVGVNSTFIIPREADFVVVVNGELCTPCRRLTEQTSVVSVFSGMQVHTTGAITVIWRKDNEGMDFAAHNVTLEYIRHYDRKYKSFIFLNSSVRGPFVPNYVPESWQWTDVFTRFLEGDVKAVGSSIVCLPEADAGGYGPKLESWAFAVDRQGLEILIGAGIFHIQTCKLCDDGIVVQQEYGITKAIFANGYNIATLLSKYDPHTDWRLKEHWDCNNNVHPSRHATYDGISMHPYETVFIKSSWHVGEPFTSTYSTWFRQRAQDQSTPTQGKWNEAAYRFAISVEAQEAVDMSTCYANVTARRTTAQSTAAGDELELTRDDVSNLTAQHSAQHGRLQDDSEVSHARPVVQTKFQVPDSSARQVTQQDSMEHSAQQEDGGVVQQHLAVQQGFEVRDTATEHSAKRDRAQQQHEFEPGLDGLPQGFDGPNDFV